MRKDALSVIWYQKNNLYLFPPVNVCSQILKKVNLFQSSMTLMALLWRAQPRFTSPSLLSRFSPTCAPRTHTCWP